MYHHVIDMVISMTQATEETERDDTTLDTQKWLAFTASHETLLANMQQRLEECTKERTGTPPPAVIDTSDKDTSLKSRRSQKDNEVLQKV